MVIEEARQAHKNLLALELATANAIRKSARNGEENEFSKAVYTLIQLTKERNEDSANIIRKTLETYDKVQIR